MGMIMWLALPAMGQAVTFGETGTGTAGSTVNGYLMLCQFTCPADGTINRINLRVDYTNGSGRVAIYSNAGADQPGVLLAESASQGVSTGWNTFTVASTAVSNGATYWLAFQLNSSITGVRYYTDSNLNKQRYYNYAYAAFPANLSGSPPNGSLAARTCIYAFDVETPTPTLTASATATLSATISPTATITPTVTDTPTLTSTATPSDSPTRTVTTTTTPTGTITPTATITLTSTISPTFTISPTATVSPMVTATVLPASSLTSTPNLLAEVLLNGKQAMVFPNPARDEVRFLVHLDRAATLRLDLFNSNGERIAGLDAALPAGRGQVIQWDCRDVAPGVYHVRLLKDGQAWEKLKVAVVR